MMQLATRALGLKARLLASPDREHEMAFNRIIAAVLAVVLNGLAPAGVLNAPWPFAMAAGYLACALALCIHMIFRPSEMFLRRQTALGLDLAACSFEMHAGGATTAWIYPAYLWIVFGNGFRFGPKQLLVAMVAAIGAFSLVIASSRFWWSQPSICAGLLIGLLVIPLYTFSLLDKLSRARRQADEANRAKSLFLAKVSHELRTPLNAIIGFGALLSDGRLDSEQRDMTQTILSSGRSLLSLIDSILDLSRLEAGRMPVSLTDFDLCDLMEELRRMVLAQAREKRLSVTVHVTARTRTELRGDVARLREILLNLLSNAVKFTEKGSIVIAADAVSVGDGSVRLRFEVDDTGIGIAQDAQKRIFDMFTQADETIANRYGGTGLGLSITRQLVELLGGAIGIDSQLGHGALVWVELDVQLSHRAAQAPRSWAETRCFLIDDPDEVAEPILRTLDDMGLRVETLGPADRDAILRGRGGALAAEPGAALFAAVRGASDSSGFAAASLPRGEALRFFDVLEDAAAAPASRSRRRSVATRISVSASPAELVKALHVCDALTVERDDGTGPAAVRRAAHAYRVLVADDNRVNQKVMTRILERSGYQVLLACDGEEMLDLLEAAPADVVIVDVNMPNMDGIEATQIFRVASLGGTRTPVVGVTADATVETREQCLAAGMDVCLLKPVEPATLLKVLDELLASRQPEHVAAEPSEQARNAVKARAEVEGAAAGAVRSIASHPRFRLVTTPPIDPAMLENLRVLGGEAFVCEIIDDFLAETEELIAALRDAARSVDVEKFRASAHALRSGAANIGCRPLCDLCEPWEAISADHMRQHATSHLTELSDQFSKLHLALIAYKSDLGTRESWRR